MLQKLMPIPISDPKKIYKLAGIRDATKLAQKEFKSPKNKLVTLQLCSRMQIEIADGEVRKCENQQLIVIAILSSLQHF